LAENKYGRLLQVDVECAQYASGVGYVRRTRKTLNQESEMEIFPVQFVDISGIVPPADAKLEMIVGDRKG